MAGGGGVIIGVMVPKKLGVTELQTRFNIGPDRVKRLFAQNEAVHKKLTHFTDAEIDAARKNIASWPSEVGFACSHKWQREYLISGSFSANYRTYVAEQEKDSLRALGFGRF